MAFTSFGSVRRRADLNPRTLDSRLPLVYEELPCYRWLPMTPGNPLYPHLSRTALRGKPTRSISYCSAVLLCLACSSSHAASLGIQAALGISGKHVYLRTHAHTCEPLACNLHALTTRKRFGFLEKLSSRFFSTLDSEKKTKTVLSHDCRAKLAAGKKPDVSRAFCSPTLLPFLCALLAVGGEDSAADQRSCFAESAHAMVGPGGHQESETPSPGSGQNILRVVASRHATCRTNSCMKMLSHYWEVCSVYRQVTKRSLREGPEAKEVPGNFRCHPAQVRKKRSS